MRRQLYVLLFLVLLVLLAACSNTVEGIQEDTNQNIDEAQEELNDGEGE